jgi:subfamily B ATP-binding cassette protein MsbA
MGEMRIKTGRRAYGKPGEKGSWKALVRLGRYLPPLKGTLIAAGVCLVLASLSGLGVGVVTKDFLDAIKTAQTTGEMAEVNRWTLIALGLFLLKGILSYGREYYMASAAQRLAMRLRNQVFSHLQAQSMSFYDARKTGQLMSSITNDVPAVQNNFTAAILDAIDAPVTIVGGVGILLVLNWRLALVSLVCLPLMAWLIVNASRRMRRNAARLQGCLAEVSEVAEETLAGHRAVKAFANERYEVDRFNQKSQSIFRTIMRSVQIRAAMGPTVEIIGAAGMILVLWFGGSEIVRGGKEPGALTIGGLTAFIVILKQIADCARGTASISLCLSSASAAAERIFNLLDMQPEIRDRPDAVPLPPARGRVSFEHVGFAYRSGIPVLSDINFSIEPGQVVALVGRSGAGKSTIAALIPRFYDVSAGAVRIDGTDVRDVTMESLRAQIGIVPQDPHLFGGSILENIAYGRLDATEEEIVAAAVAANAHEFISELPQGYTTVIGERGVRLSGGQRQRLSIARAILRDPRILILDEATSSLDTHSEALVQDALQRLVSHRTTLVIAHRLSTIRHADVILVVDQGQIVERGTHDELIVRNGIYAQLHRTQFRFDEEVEAVAS